MTEPESTWRVWSGGGLLIHAPMSDERRELIRRESEREAQRAEFEAEQRRLAAIERRQEMLMQGREPHTVADVLQTVSAGMDRQDRRDAAADARNAELFGRGKPHQTAALLAEAKAEREARKAELEATPASKADLGRVATSLARLKEGVFAVTGHKIPL